ncbi:hypothetical protein KKP04_08060 [Rhodomicrobium sp. Az07]|uniref:hypothetical protein n=1 Tax=Rhodomicrobium sp. Az07 TaxID=2839034 RepID=UPI001BE82127|nr:hypothetical protein [Rhodomicrobium sp. Az07]MBT3070819.1 hypothetical protein [Rhodomicrobium sp. Az07]
MALSLISFLVFCGLEKQSHADSANEQQNAQRVKIEQHPNGTAKGDRNTSQQQKASSEKLIHVQETPPSHLRMEGQPDSQKSGDDASEFWVISGRKLKITDTLLAIFTFFLVVIGAWQGHVISGQIELARGQSADTKASIAEAVRAATAMERVADGIAESVKTGAESVAALRERTAMQMRAYVSVLVGTAIYQEREKNVRFEARPVIVNNGGTPAHKLSYWANIAILPAILPDDFAFPEPSERSTQHAAVLGPHQHFIINKVVETFIPDDEVAATKLGVERAVYIWGCIEYDDIFGDTHYTKFAQLITWIGSAGEEVIYGYYCQRHNEAN